MTSELGALVYFSYPIVLFHRRNILKYLMNNQWILSQNYGTTNPQIFGASGSKCNRALNIYISPSHIIKHFEKQLPPMLPQTARSSCMPSTLPWKQILCKSSAWLTSAEERRAAEENKREKERKKEAAKKERDEARAAKAGR